MGVVARARHLDLDQPVAIKLLLPQALENQSAVRRFRREARAMVQLKSEHVSRVFDVGTLENGAPYMVMEYLEGKDLGQWLREQGPLDPGFAVDLMLQACEALAEAHALGVVHRDIKPANFFLTSGPDGAPLLKVIDFGIAKALHAADEDFTTSQALVGTPTYMSPEQMHSSKHVDARTDIWALGAVLYELVSGRRPFRGDSYAGLVLAVTSAPMRPLDDVALAAGLAEIITRCLQKQPSERFGSVAELADALAPHAATAAQAERSRERAARILAFASSPANTGHVAAESSPPTVQARKASRPDGLPPTETRTQSVASGSPDTPSGPPDTATQPPPTATTFELASQAAMTRADAAASPPAPAAGRASRLPLIVSAAIAAGLVMGLLLARGQRGPEPATPEPEGIVEAAGSRANTAAAVEPVAPRPAGAPDTRAAVAPPSPHDAGAEAGAPAAPAERAAAAPAEQSTKAPAERAAAAPAEQSAKAPANTTGRRSPSRRKDGPRHRAGATQPVRDQERAGRDQKRTTPPDKATNQDVFDEFD